MKAGHQNYGVSSSLRPSTPTLSPLLRQRISFRLGHHTRGNGRLQKQPLLVSRWGAAAARSSTTQRREVVMKAVNRVAMEEEEDIDHVLFNEETILNRVTELGAQITEDFKSKSLTVVGIASGAFLFLADLVRCVSVPMQVDLIRASSYGDGTVTSGTVQLSGHLKAQVEGKDVLVVEDIIDTGITLAALTEHFRSLGASSVSVCVLLDKKERREVPLQLTEGGKTYVGFECPNEFVVGYGLDFQEKYRNLPYIGILKPALYAEA